MIDGVLSPLDTMFPYWMETLSPRDALCSGNSLDLTKGQQLGGKCPAQQGAPKTLLVSAASRGLF